MLVLLVLDGIASYWLAVYFSERAYDSGLYDSARSLATQVKIVDGEVTVDLPREALEIFQWDISDRTYFAVTSRRRGLIIGYRAFPQPAVLPVRELDPTYYNTFIGGEPVRAVAVRLAVPDDQVNVLVGETMKKREGLTREILVAILAPQLLLALVTLLLLRQGVQSGLAPLGAVARHIERRNPQDLQAFPEMGPTEVLPLIRALNQLLLALAAAQSAQKRFIANAAHQLRSPLAALQLQAERALRDINPATHSQALQSVVVGAGRVAHIARQLLTLARAEPESSANDRFGDVDVVALAREVTSDWVPKALAEGADLGYEGEDSGPAIRGDAPLLREALSNLIDNALRYGKTKGRITVRASAKDAVEFSVEDDGPGIPKHWRDSIFDRFIRLPGSRGEGCGLGLAIVKEIALLHGGTVQIADGEGMQGVRISVRFPRPMRGSAATAG